MAKTYTAPKTKADAEALKAALAEYQADRLAAVQAFFESDECKAFEEAIAAVIEEGLPVGTTSAGNVAQLPAWFANVRRQLANDVSAVNPLTPPTETPTPMVTKAAP